LLIGQQATFRGERQAQSIQTFSTTSNLRERLQLLAEQPVDAVFHAAAVSDFGFGKIWLRTAAGEMNEIKSAKISTRQGTLLAELVPTPKIIAELRAWYPKSKLVGWKFEVAGDRSGVLELARRQLAECVTDACVVNGAAYGIGFGLVNANGKCIHLKDPASLYETLETFIRS
jgi:phosphopantothenoylcysteine decarboxylase/phosphopantothenate--cysteine ligase